MAQGGNLQQEVVVIEEEDNGWPDVGPVNPAEATAYQEKVDNMFKAFSKMLQEDRKDVKPVTIKAFKSSLQGIGDKWMRLMWSSWSDQLKTQHVFISDSTLHLGALMSQRHPLMSHLAGNFYGTCLIRRERRKSAS